MSTTTADLLLDITKYLTYRKVVKGYGKDCFCDYMPDQPDRIVALYEYSGGGTVTGVEAVERSVQVTVRSNSDDPNWARKKAWEIFNILDTPLDRVLDLRELEPKYEPSIGIRWAVSYARQTPFKIGVDKSNRVRYGFNMGITTYRD